MLGSRGIAWKGASLLTEALKAFFVSPNSADADLNNDRETLALRSRALFQNNDFSGALISSIDVKVVGNGIHARPIVDHELLGIDKECAEKWANVVQKYFDLWADNKSCDSENKNDFYQLQDLGLKTELITGDCFGLSSYNSKNPFGLKIKLLEGDRCRQPWGVQATDRLAMGIEVDKVGAPVLYYFTKKPVWGIDAVSDYCDYKAIPAVDSLGAQNVIHAFSSDRPDQRRGVPFLAPIVSQLKQQERYQDAELMAAVVSSMFTVFITSNDAAPNEFLGNVEDDMRVARNACELAPGGIATLASGEDVKFADPKRPNANYSPFIDGIFRGAAASRGLSAEQVLRQFNSSYNAVRAAILEAKKTYEKIKYNFVADFCQPIYEKFLTACVAQGLVRAEGYFDDPIKHLLWNSCRWDSDAGFMLDPTKETQAIIMQLDNQLIDRDTACRKIGGVEYSVVAAKLAEERKIRTDLGLTEPGSVSRTESTSVQVDDNNGNNEN